MILSELSLEQLRSRGHCSDTAWNSLLRCAANGICDGIVTAVVQAVLEWWYCSALLCVIIDACSPHTCCHL